MNSPAHYGSGSLFSVHEGNTTAAQRLCADRPPENNASSQQMEISGTVARSKEHGSDNVETAPEPIMTVPKRLARVERRVNRELHDAYQAARDTGQKVKHC